MILSAELGFLNLIFTSFVRSVAAILLKHKLSLVEEGFQMIKVVRNASLLNQVLDIYHDNSFSLHKHPTVYFENEEGYDAGGLTRDFFSSAMHLVF